MSQFALGGLIVLVTAVFPCLVCGYLIAFKGRRNLISGWNDRNYSDPERASKVIGISLIVMALLLALSTILWSLQFINEVTFIYCLIPVLLMPIATLVFVKLKLGTKP